MPQIGYNYQIIQPNYQPDIQNTELIAKVLMSKQKEFDLAYQGMQKLQREALNINFINKGEQKKIDNFNEEIARTFEGGEFGDLSNANTAQKYYSLFDKIGNDTSLVSKYRQDKQYQDQIRAVEGKRNSKDPAKAGFGNVNYDNFMHRVKEYANIDLDSVDGKGYVMQPYTDYVDINKEIADLAKTIVPEKFTESRVENGYIVTKTYSGRDPQKVAAATREYMGSRGLSQVREEAEYTFRRAKGNPAFQQAIYNDHVTYNLEQQKEVGTRLDKVNEELKGTTDPQKITALSAEKATLEDAMSRSSLDLKTADEYFSRNSDAIINDLSQVALLDNVKNLTAAHSGYSTSTKIEPDRTFLELQKMQNHIQEFNTQMALEQQKLAQAKEIADDKLEAKTGTTTSQTAGGQAAAAGASYISTSDATHVEYPATVDAMTQSLTKLYAEQTNFLEHGLTHGDHPLNAENAGLELLINREALDSNEYYANSPYLRAWKIAASEIYKTNPALAEHLNKKPNDNEGWNKLKEANQIIKARVNQMMTAPRNAEEAAIVNHLQDVNANKQSMQDFMEAANKSGDPATFIKNQPQIKIYGNAVYDFDIPDGATKDDKERVAQMEVMFRPSFENFLDNSNAVYDASSTKISQDQFNKQFTNPNKVRTIPYGQVRKVETGPDGTVKVFFKDTAFAAVTTNDEKNVAKSGSLSEPDAYFMVKKGNRYEKVTRDQIQSVGYLEYKDPRFSNMNWSTQLGLSVSAKPQQRWANTADGQTIEFKMLKNINTGNIEVSVMGGDWVDLKTSNAEAAINSVRARISGASLDEIQGISPQEDVARGGR